MEGGLHGHKPFEESSYRHLKSCQPRAPRAPLHYLRPPQAEEIEQTFVNWGSPARISKGYAVSRDALYRHAHALNLLEKRRRNLRAALERIIERAGDVEVSASAVVSAVAAYAKINAVGQWVERSERVNVNELFERMTRDEMEAYAADGTLPAWFQRTISSTESLSATALDSHGEVND